LDTFLAVFFLYTPSQGEPIDPGAKRQLRHATPSVLRLSSPLLVFLYFAPSNHPGRQQRSSINCAPGPSSSLSSPFLFSCLISLLIGSAVHPLFIRLFSGWVFWSPSPDDVGLNRHFLSFFPLRVLAEAHCVPVGLGSTCPRPVDTIFFLPSPQVSRLLDPSSPTIFETPLFFHFPLIFPLPDVSPSVFFQY